MNTTFATTALTTLCLVLLGSVDALAQQEPGLQTSVSGQQIGIVEPANEEIIAKKVGFRMANWRTIHGDGTPATKELIATLQKIGCEVQQNNHGGHVDIAFRCAGWKTVTVETDEQSQQWHSWLANNKFETVVINPSESSGMPVVKVRLPEWKTIHARNSEEARILKETYELIGCEVVIDNHGDHIDAKIRCVNWNTIGLSNVDAAHVWQDWLSKSGFETQHDHTADGHDSHSGHDHPAEPGHEGHDHSTDDHSGHNHDGHVHK